MTYLTEIIMDQENRLRGDNLRIIGLPEKAEANRNFDIILQRNYPGILS